MSGSAKIEIKESVSLKLYGPDGKLKQTSGTPKPGLLTKIFIYFILIFVITYQIIKWSITQVYKKIKGN